MSLKYFKYTTQSYECNILTNNNIYSYTVLKFENLLWKSLYE